MNKFPLKILPENLREAVEAVRITSGVPPELSAPIFLSAMASVAQDKIDVDSLEFGPKPVSLYFMPLAASGAGKSTVSSIIEKVYQKWFDYHHIEYQHEKTAYDIAQTSWKIESDKLSKQPHSQSKQNDILALSKRKPAEPVEPSRVITDFTPIGLINRYLLSHPSQYLFTDEGINFLQSHSMKAENGQSGTMIGNLTTLWDAKPLDRNNSNRNVSISGRRLSASIITQPSVASSFLGNKQHSGQGILARFLVSSCPSFERPNMDRFSPESQRIKADCKDKITIFSNRLFELLSIKYKHSSDDPRKIEASIMGWDYEANKAAQDWFNNELKPTNDGSPFYERRYEHGVRLAAVIAFWNGHSKISLSDFNIASSLIKYFQSELDALDLTSASERDSSDAPYIEATNKWFKNKTNGYTLAKLRRSGPSWMRTANEDVIEHIINVMLKREDLFENIEIAGNGKETIYYSTTM